MTMTQRTASLIACLCLGYGTFAQKNKVQAAWRALTDYEVTVTDGRPDPSFLNKANDAIDLALQHEDTKNKGRTHAYKARISYAKFQAALSQELKRLETSVADKTERLLTAYGNIPLNDFETAASEIVTIRDVDPKFMDNINEGLAKGVSMLDEDDMKFAEVAQKVKIESANIASGKYKVKKYDEAADYFYRTAIINTVLYKTKDTADFYNAAVSAAKARNNEKILDYNKKMIDAGLPVAYNYQSIASVHLSKADTNLALETLKKGRMVFPEDVGLITDETNIYLAKGQRMEALNNLKISSAKDPKNPFYYLMMGIAYDNLANPKDKVSGKDLPRPANFAELFQNAEDNYKKAIELNPANKDYLSGALRNLGAMYNNYGGFVENQHADKITDMAKYQREDQAKAQEYYKKAIPYLEQALAITSDDLQSMKALRILYLKTKDEAKAQAMNERIKNYK